MKLQIITVGRPKLDYARSGFQLYSQRLKHYHQLSITHIPDKHNDSTAILAAAANSFLVAMDEHGQAFSSASLAHFLEQRALAAQEVSFVIGGAEGLPAAVLSQARLIMSLSQLTMPHDLAMVVLAETLYRAATMNAGHPYHNK